MFPLVNPCCPLLITRSLVFQDYLYLLFRDQVEADQAAGPWILLLALFEERSGICFLFLTHCSRSPPLFHDYQEWPCNDIRALGLTMSSAAPDLMLHWFHTESITTQIIHKQLHSYEIQVLNFLYVPYATILNPSEDIYTDKTRIKNKHAR